MASEEAAKVKVQAVEIRAQLLRIRTRADRTSDLTLNVPEDCTEQVKVLFGWLMDEVGLIFVNTPKDLTELDDDEKQADQRPEKRASKVGRRRS